jgi:hypothetical protein
MRINRFSKYATCIFFGLVILIWICRFFQQDVHHPSGRFVDNLLINYLIEYNDHEKSGIPLDSDTLFDILEIPELSGSKQFYSDYIVTMLPDWETMDISYVYKNTKRSIRLKRTPDGSLSVINHADTVSEKGGQKGVRPQKTDFPSE